MQTQQDKSRQASAIPNVIFALLIINGLVFAAQQFAPRVWFGLTQLDLLTVHFGLWPVATPDVLPDFKPWQLLTYAFLHDTDSILHITFNMFMLFMFGREIEHVMGSGRFLIYYVVCVIGAAIVQLTFANFTGSFGPTIGASGGVFGILLAFGMLFPNQVIMLIFPPIPMKAKYMVILFGLLELYLGVSGKVSGIAHFAHLGGMLFGFVLILYWARVRRR